MKNASFIQVVAIILLVSCTFGCDLVVPGGKKKAATQDNIESTTLREARSGFQPKHVDSGISPEPVDQPPANVFRLVKYDSAVGKLPAYVSPDPKDEKKHPAIIWITGGDCNSIGDVWSDIGLDNEQTASVYRKSGIIMMFPSLRGGNENPGKREGFFGEVDDIVAAADFLAREPYVDPERIYLGGHSTGGTLALITAECSPRFRAVFSFGPVSDPGQYGRIEYAPFDTKNAKERLLRNAGLWLHGIESPCFVFEGSEGSSNVDCLEEMRDSCKNSNVAFFPVPGHDHFSVLHPINSAIAKKILVDTGTGCNITFTENEIIAAGK